MYTIICESFNFNADEVIPVADTLAGWKHVLLCVACL